MIKTQIHAEIVGHSLSPQGDELISVLCTFPRIILAEVNTHRMLSKNTSSSRAIPFNKMVEAVQENPFIPIAWQKDHKGMQGTEYLADRKHENAVYEWLKARDYAVKQARMMNNDGVTKQLCNRLLEPFMWTTMLITGSKEGWDNFFNLRCGNYDGFKSRKEASKEFLEKGNINTSTWSELDWLHLNKGQAEIHIMDLAEKIYDAVNESTPKQLSPNEWHIPFSNKIPFVGNLTASVDEDNTYWRDYDEQNKVKISVASAARTSYTVVGEEKEINFQKMIELHDRLISQDPPHSSPLEHCARAMSDEEYECFLKGEREINKNANHWSDVEYFYDYDKIFGWCNNLKGFIPYRYMIDNNLI